MTSVRLTLPFPPRALSPNARVHWAVKAAAVKDYRFACMVIAKNKGVRFTGAVKARLIFECGSRLWDQDNCTAAFKAGWDGIVDSRLLVDDSPEHLHVVETLVQKGTKREVRVLLEGEG